MTLFICLTIFILILFIIKHLTSLLFQQYFINTEMSEEFLKELEFNKSDLDRSPQGRDKRASTFVKHSTTADIHNKGSCAPSAPGGMSNKLKNKSNIQNKLNKFKKQQACERERTANLHNHFHEPGGHHHHFDDGEYEGETFVSL